MGNRVARWPGDIVGMPAFQAGRTAHLAGVMTSGDRLRIRLIAPSPDLPSRIATLAFCAVPDDTPMTAQHQPIPSAGPYYIVPSSRDQLVLARNPNYGGHRARIPERIVYSFGVGLRRAVKQVAAGRSDYLDASSFSSGANSADAPALLQMLERRYGAARPAARSGHERYFVNPWLSLDYLVFNTARPVFASSRVRRAVNYAIDRRALVQHNLLSDGRATDHYLLPGIPGARPVNAYPLGGPDLAEARRLAAGVHADATLLIPAGDPHTAEDAAIVKADLAEIGITIEITPLSGAKLYRRLKTPGDPWDIATANWADFADPFTMINELYDPATAAAADFGHFNDPALTRRMRQAATLSGDSRLQAYARLDEDLTETTRPAPHGASARSATSSPRVPDARSTSRSTGSTSEASAFDSEPDYLGLSHTSRPQTRAPKRHNRARRHPQPNGHPMRNPVPTLRLRTGLAVGEDDAGERASRSPKSAARGGVNANNAAAAPSPDRPRRRGCCARSSPGRSEASDRTGRTPQASRGFVNAEASDRVGRRQRAPRRESPSRVCRVVGFVHQQLRRRSSGSHAGRPRVPRSSPCDSSPASSQRGPTVSSWAFQG